MWRRYANQGLLAKKTLPCAPHYPMSGRPGRQSYALATMLRIHRLQHWHASNDPAMEEALHQIPTLRRFARLGGLDNVPDTTPIPNVRRLLETHGLAAQMRDAVNAHLARKGQRCRQTGRTADLQGCIFHGR